MMNWYLMIKVNFQILSKRREKPFFNAFSGVQHLKKYDDAAAADGDEK